MEGSRKFGEKQPYYWRNMCKCDLPKIAGPLIEAIWDLIENLQNTLPYTLTILFPIPTDLQYTIIN